MATKPAAQSKLQRPKESPQLLKPDHEPKSTGYAGLDTGLNEAEIHHPNEQRWLPIASLSAHFPRDAWMKVMEDWIYHPERTSPIILRAEVKDETSSNEAGVENGEEEEKEDWPNPEKFSSQKASEQPFRLLKKFHRRLLPRQEQLDGSLDQICAFYERDRLRASTSTSSSSNQQVQSASEVGHSAEAEDSTPSYEEDGLVVYTPILTSKDGSEIVGYPSSSQIPYFHPTVKAIAFRYIGSDTHGQTVDSNSSILDPELKVYGTLQIDIIPFSFPTSKDEVPILISNRLERIILNLLSLSHKHSLGNFQGYKKRVQHDVLVSKNIFQDIYNLLKRKHAIRLLKDWKEITDPGKHVFEDIGIVTWLICFWKKEYEEFKPKGIEKDEKRPWLNWGRPPGGFVDLGCGNGLLVHILNCEGYNGYGFDLRARKSWKVWKDSKGGADLRVLSLNVPEIVLNSSTSTPSSLSSSASFFPKGSFLIGNHADELTPWLPLISSVTPESSFVNIPCCPWKNNGEKFIVGHYEVDEDKLKDLLGISCNTSSIPFEEKEISKEEDDEILRSTLSEIQRGSKDLNSISNLNNSSANINSSSVNPKSDSRNIAYLNYLSEVHLSCGYHLEKEALRIPSTKNWALIGRRRIWEKRPKNLLDEINGNENDDINTNEDSFSHSKSKNNSIEKGKREKNGEFMIGIDEREERNLKNEEWRNQIKSKCQEFVRNSVENAYGWKARTPEGNVGKVKIGEEK